MGPLHKCAGVTPATAPNARGEVWRFLHKVSYNVIIEAEGEIGGTASGSGQGSALSARGQVVASVWQGSIGQSWW